jgi:hypothetical protein
MLKINLKNIPAKLTEKWKLAEVIYTKDCKIGIQNNTNKEKTRMLVWLNLLNFEKQDRYSIAITLRTSN